MGRIIGGLGSPHAPSIGALIDQGGWDQPEWKKLMDGYRPMQDWLAAHDTEALRDEWELILANSVPGAKILMRSAGVNLDFVPDAIRSRVRFFPERTEALHQLDRVGTYGSLHFAEVL